MAKKKKNKIQSPKNIPRFFAWLTSGSPSFVVWCIVGIYWITLVAEEGRWKTGETVVADVKSYYTYLPAAFIQNDLTLQSINTLPAEDGQYIWYGWADGKRYIRMPMGTAICYTPFFLVAHAVASNSDQWPATGYSLPYFLALHLSALFFGLWGMWLVRKLCREFMSDFVAALVLLLLAFGTNLTFYATYHAPYSHIYSFWGIALFCWLTKRWYDTQQEKGKHLRTSIALGLLAGLITLIRPTNAIIVLVFLLWNVTSWSAFKGRWRLFWDNKGVLTVLVMCALAVVFLQLLYWKSALGTWFFYTYENEGFNFSNPHLSDFLFSFRKGWLLYTPVMAFSILGLCWLRSIARPVFIAVLVHFSIYLFVISSWHAWWYGDGYGQRAMVEIYPLLALPLGAFLTKIGAKRNLLLIGGTAVVLGFLLFLNTVQERQYKLGIIHYDGMTQEAYAAVWMQEQHPRNMSNYIVQPDLARSYAGLDEYISSTSEFTVAREFKSEFPEAICTVLESRKVVQLDSSNYFSPVFSIPLENLTSPKKRVQARCTVHLQCETISSQEQFSYFTTVVANPGGFARRTDSWAGTLDQGQPTFLIKTIDLWGPFTAQDSLKLVLEYHLGPPVFVDSCTVEILEYEYDQ